MSKCIKRDGLVSLLNRHSVILTDNHRWVTYDPLHDSFNVGLTECWYILNGENCLREMHPEDEVFIVVDDIDVSRYTLFTVRQYRDYVSRLME